MSLRRLILLGFLIACLCDRAEAQERSITVGFQFKPIFTSSFINRDLKPYSSGTTELSFRQPSGHTFDMLIRRGYTKTVSFETGINTTKRNYLMTIIDSAFSGTSGFSTIGYEVPFSLLTFIRLGEHLYMNASMGASLDMYPSDVQSSGDYFKHISYRIKLFSPGLLANLGCEYRTAKSGYFYLGASYHRPLQKIFETHVTYRAKTTIDAYLSGSYLTADLRYFFNAEPMKKKERKARVKKTKRVSSSD